MGRNSGGVRSNAPGKQGGSGKGKTEEGYTKLMLKNIVGIEQTYRTKPDETLHIFSPTGTLLHSMGGKGAGVAGDGWKIPENTVLTHNHPRAIGKKGLQSIGNSFSFEDINTAVSTNAREMRAVTPRYTFSVKRPKSGWGATPDQIRLAWNSAHKATQSQFYAYINKHGGSQAAIDRASALHFHRVMSIVSKKFGWNYTKKKG